MPAVGQVFMMNRTSKGPRAEHCQRQRQRVDESSQLTASYPQLKALTVHLEYLDPEGIIKTREVKYRVNLDHAKSVFLFACPNTGCIGGDFDLTAQLAQAITAHRTAVTGEMFCEGHRKKPSSETVPCRSLLRYKLTLAYFARKGAAKVHHSAGRI